MACQSRRIAGHILEPRKRTIDFIFAADQHNLRMDSKQLRCGLVCTTKYCLLAEYHFTMLGTPDSV